ESLDREALARLQLERMRATLARCRRNAAWRRRLGDARPADVKRAEDWARLPFLSKDELRDAYPYGLACGEDYRRVHMSSGTTGMTETGGPGLGIDCAARAGLHVWEDHYLVEIVDPSTGASRPDGEEGELVVSTLTREGLPLVRYRTHDLTRVVSRARCECGRTSLRLDRLRGRTDDMVIFKGVNFYPRQVETVLLRYSGLSHEYQIVLEADGGGERMTIVAETEPGCDPAVAQRITRELHDLLSLSPEIRL